MSTSTQPSKSRPVVVFDIDGCLAQSFSGETITDFAFWERIWSDPDAAVNEEMVTLARSLLSSGVHVAILTGRPDRYRGHTEKWLHRVIGGWHGYGHWSLTMHPGDASATTDWKAETVRAWKEDGVDVLFAIEDYPPNARAIRRHVPVLLYECLRPLDRDT